jgi:hypothetical protein
MDCDSVMSMFHSFVVTSFPIRVEDINRFISALVSSSSKREGALISSSSKWEDSFELMTVEIDTWTWLHFYCFAFSTSLTTSIT